jgi:ubiquitin carboxyl-terminal hydrolase 4/11/15
VTSAAYLLFYRRRSNGPLGGPRFAEIYNKFDNPNEEDSATEVGDEQHSDDSFDMTRRGLPSHAGTTTTIRPLTSSDDDELHPYGHSTLDEGVEMDDQYQPLEGDSNPISQAWSFGDVVNSADRGSDCASDTVQVSSDDERAAFDPDVEMNSVIGDASDAENPPPAAARGGLISVPAETGSDRDSEEVTEIHVESDRDPRA